MRVIGGIYRGRTLRSASGLEIRPTSDRLRETLFNILAKQIEESNFLDLCAGSGAVGIEALSRGAGNVTFVERSRPACETIKANLNALGVESAIRIINREVTTALKVLSRDSETFDVVFFDPPYASDAYDAVMTELGQSNLVSKNAVVVVEHRKKTPPKPCYDKLKMFRQVNQGESALAFYSIAD
jgi:16S rRNA (guanine(966)-N(2))-methyltransferase RsmD